MPIDWISMRSLVRGAVFGLALGVNTLVGAAPVVSISFDGGTAVNVPLIQGPTGVFNLQTPNLTIVNPLNSLESVKFAATQLTDPSITFSVSATNSDTAVHTYGFTFVLDGISLPAGPTIVTDQLRGSAADNNGDGVSILGFSGPPQVTVPTSNGTELEHFNLSRGTTLVNAGVDVGPNQTFAGNGMPQTFTLFTSTGNVASLGPVAGPSGPFDDIRADLVFSLTGGGDNVSFTGLKSVTSAVPEPSSLVLGGIGVLTLFGHATWRRRKTAPA
jgi:hypothetical protein